MLHNLVYNIHHLSVVAWIALTVGTAAVMDLIYVEVRKHRN